jgi:hypothetical protein
MADTEQQNLLRKDVMAWRTWRKRNPETIPDLRGANLSGLNLSNALLSHAILLGADLSNADLSKAWLVEANLRGVNLSGANLAGASLARAILSESSTVTPDQTTLHPANLSNAILSGAYIGGATFEGADLSGADLSGADLSGATFVRSNLTRANLSGCRVYGLSVWDVNLELANQNSLIVTPPGEPEITVDNLEVAQFIYLLLRNAKLRDVIDSITSKVVLILGRFTSDRKQVLDRLRDELRNRNYLPVLFDFEKPESRDLTETISTLAHMARFVIADITDARSIPQELSRIVPELPSVPVQPIILARQSEYAMFEHFKRFSWVLPMYEYENTEDLISSLEANVIAPAEQKAELQRV